MSWIREHMRWKGRVPHPRRPLLKEKPATAAASAHAADEGEEVVTAAASAHAAAVGEEAAKRLPRVAAGQGRAPQRCTLLPERGSAITGEGRGGETVAEAARHGLAPTARRSGAKESRR